MHVLFFKAEKAERPCVQVNCSILYRVQPRRSPFAQGSDKNGYRFFSKLLIA